jgi:diaminopimelate epimerase
MIPFHNYAAYGNNFIFIDEIEEQVLSEAAKPEFARRVTNQNFGIGADAMIVLQPSQDADYAFRIFEPNGTESLSCGNGLLCAAHHLNLAYGIEMAILVTKSSRWVTVGVLDEGYQVEIGPASPMPRELVNAVPEKLDDMIAIQHMDDTLSYVKYWPYTGFLVYTGEPHLIFFLDPGNPALHEIGKVLNNRPLDGPFPFGINVSFARVLDKNTIEYRVFERGIRKETMACGTGAVAIAAVAHQLEEVDSSVVKLHPVRYRNHCRDAYQHVERDSLGIWWLEGEPVFLASGYLALENFSSNQ